MFESILCQVTDYDPSGTYDKRAVELRQFLDSAAQIWVRDMPNAFRVPFERVQNQLTRLR